MTVSKSHKARTSETHSSRSAPSAPPASPSEATPTPEPSQTPPVAQSAPTSSSVVDTAALALHASDSLRTIEGELHLTTALTAEEKKANTMYLRIPADAISVGIDVATRQPGRFPDFDINAARMAVGYAQNMGPVAQQYRDAAARIEESILARHATSAQQLLALYGSMKAVARTPKGQSMLPQISKLHLLIRTRVKRRAPSAPTTLTQPTPAPTPAGSPTGQTSIPTPQPQPSALPAAPTGTAPASTPKLAPNGALPAPAPVPAPTAATNTGS